MKAQLEAEAKRLKLDAAFSAPKPKSKPVKPEPEAVIDLMSDSE